MSAITTGQPARDARPATGVPPGPPAIVELRQASKLFGDRVAVDRLDLAVGPGQLFGLIGPSGCGKTTTIRLLVGVLLPTSGTVRVLGVEPRTFSIREREQIGYTPQSFVLYPTLTAYENLRFVGALYGLSWLRRRRRARELLQLLELWDARRRLARHLSGGMQRRLQLASTLMHRPALVFIDEPTAGLDPVLRDKIWSYLRLLRDQGTTVFVTTQYIDETERCDNVAILEDGRLVAAGSPQQLKRRAFGGDVITVRSDTWTPETIAAIRRLPDVREVHWTGPDQMQLIVDDAGTVQRELARRLKAGGDNVVATVSEPVSFDEVFKRIVHHGS